MGGSSKSGRVLLITEERSKREKSFIKVDREKIIYENKAEGHSRVHKIEELYVALWREGFPDHSFMNGGTRRSKLFNALPLLVSAKIFRKSRRR
jgi:hypothetical protein